MKHSQRLSGSEYFAAQMKRYVSRFDIIIFAAAFAMTVLVHMYMFTHKLLNHDDVVGLYSDCGFGLSSGRWLLATVKSFAGTFSSSWLSGSLGAFFLAVGILLVVRLFRIRHYIPALLLAFCVVSFPVLTATYSYMFCAPIYLFAFALSACGALLIGKGKLQAMAVGTVLITLAMGCYQAYFCFAAMLLVALLGIDLFEGCYAAQWKCFFITAVKYVISLAVGIILYFVILCILLKVTGTSLAMYHGMDTMGQIGLRELGSRVIAAYSGFADFCMNRLGFFREGFTKILIADVVFLLTVVVYRVIKLKIYKSPVMLLFSVLLIGFFPLASGLMYIMTETQYVHTVMMYPMVGILLLPAVVMDRITVVVDQYGKITAKSEKLKASLFVLLLCAQLLCGYEGAVTANQAYFYMDMTYENVYSYFVKLTVRIDMQEAYHAEMPVALIGYRNMDTVVPDMQAPCSIRICSCTFRRSFA